MVRSSREWRHNATEVGLRGDASGLIDQDLDQVILRGLLLRIPNLDVVTAHQADLSGNTDPELLAWAAEQARIVVTHDRRTMPYHATDRMAEGERVAGIIIVSRRLPVSQVIDDLEIIVSCSEVDEWENVLKIFAALVILGLRVPAPQ